MDKKIVIKSDMKFNKILKGNTTDLVSSIAVSNGLVAFISGDMKSGVYYEFENHSIKAIEDVIQTPAQPKKSKYEIGEYCMLDPNMSMDHIETVMESDCNVGFVAEDMPSYRFSIGKILRIDTTSIQKIVYEVGFNTSHHPWVYPPKVLVGLSTEKIEELISTYASKI